MSLTFDDEKLRARYAIGDLETDVWLKDDCGLRHVVSSHVLQLHSSVLGDVAKVALAGQDPKEKEQGILPVIPVDVSSRALNQFVLGMYGTDLSESCPKDIALVNELCRFGHSYEIDMEQALVSVVCGVEISDALVESAVKLYQTAGDTECFRLQDTVFDTMMQLYPLRQKVIGILSGTLSPRHVNTYLKAHDRHPYQLTILLNFLDGILQIKVSLSLCA